jgi:hypothetical protein
MFADVPDHLWEGYDFACPAVTNRLEQGPFGITQDAGWYTIFVTQPSGEHIRNFGTGLVGYTWEENGPALSVECGKETLEQAVEKMASLPSWMCSTSVAIGGMCTEVPASSNYHRFGKLLSMLPSATIWA